MIYYIYIYIHTHTLYTPYIVCFLVRSDTKKLCASTGEVKQHASSTARHRHHSLDFSQHPSSPVLKRLLPAWTLHDIAPSGATADARQSDSFRHKHQQMVIRIKNDSLVGVREKHIIMVKQIFLGSKGSKGRKVINGRKGRKGRFTS